MVKYNVVEVTRLIIKVLLEDLHQNFDYNKKTIMDFKYDLLLPMCQNCTIWDIENGVILDFKARRVQLNHACL